MGTPLEGYVAFRKRALFRLGGLAGLQRIEQPHLVGAAATSAAPRGGLLLLDAAGADALLSTLDHLLPQWIGLLAHDEALIGLLAQRGWDAVQVQTAMALADLTALRPAPLPPGVEVVPVSVAPNTPGFPLFDALRVELEHSRADETAPVRDLALEARLMRELPGIRFLAAVNRAGRCVATAGSRIVDESALVAGVVTIPQYRGRGLATAMTRAALESARTAGARNAYLDATDAGVGIYRRLGFEEVRTVVYCERSGRAV